MKRKHDDAASRALFKRNGWPDPGRMYILDWRGLMMRYALAVFLGAVIGGPALAVVAVKHFCGV